MRFPVHNISGEVIKEMELSDDVFGVPMNQAVVHQAMVQQQANRRLGTADTKTRSDVAGSTRKLYRQKHTGMARSGVRRSPLRRGGGVVFGPHPRGYRQAMPKKMRRLALRCLLSAKAADGGLILVDALELKQPKTKELTGMLKALEVNSSVLVVTPQPDTNLVKSGRNVERVKMLPAALLNVLDLLSHKALVMTLGAVEKVEELWGGKRPQEEQAITSLKKE